MKLSLVSSRRSSTDHTLPRKHTPWISSPLDREALKSLGTDEATKLNSNDSMIELDDRRRNNNFSRRDLESPIFKKHHEASTIELFYDLFFVANLATFTSNHEIENGHTLGSYLGFFTLLWFTWLQTTLFDVRFSNDSVLARIFKALAFGVMTGFAVVGPLFETSDEEYSALAFRSLSLILMASRLCLVFQYGVVLWYVRNYKKTLVPLALTMGILLFSAILFLVLFFCFPEEGGARHVYAGWYVVVAAEAIAMITISCIWRVLSFKHTPLVERAGLLTLIVIGEGIIGLTKSVTQIMNNSKKITGGDIGTVIVAVLLVYFLWVLYFDQIEHDRFGTIRQQIWTLLHFPLHVAILLTVEGSTQFITWWALVEKINVIDEILLFSSTTISGTNSTIIAEELGATLAEIEKSVAYKFSIAPATDFASNLTAISELDLSTAAGATELNTTVTEIWTRVLVNLFVAFDLTPPEAQGGTDTSEQVQEIANVFDTVYLFFFIAAGCFLVILGVMYWFGKQHKSRGEMISVFVRVVAGVGLALVSIVDSSGFVLSPWMIPTVVLTFFAVIVIDNLLIWHANKVIARQSSRLGSDDYS